MSAGTLTILARIYPLGLLLSILPGSWAQVRLVESGGKVTQEGQSITLTCKASGFNFKEYDMSWHWSRNVNHREFVASISASTFNIREFSPRIQGRATINRNDRAETVSLTLHRLRKEDSGKYYCARLTHSAKAQTEVWTKTWD